MSNASRVPAKGSLERYGFPHLLVIDASAGTGKTNRLARRYVEFILTPESRVPHNDISNLLAITFTNKAAKEMRTRVLLHLKKLALKLDDEFQEEMLGILKVSPEELPLIAEQRIVEILDRYSDFQIQTIDSFMNRVGRSAALELELRPDFQTTTSTSEINDYSMSLMLREVGRDRDMTSLLDDFLMLLNRIHHGSFIWDPETELMGTFEKLLHIEDKETKELVFEDRYGDARECLDEVVRVYSEITAPSATKDPPSSFEEALKEGNIQLISKKYNPDKPPMDERNVSDETYQDALKRWSELAPIVNRMALSYSSSFYHPYGKAFRQFKTEMETAKRRTGTIAIGDLSKKLHRYLDREVVPDIYLSLGERLYHFMIDEFQDTNPVQWESLSPLIDESLSKNGTLFLVGDLKQAIYMFRNADYRIMRDALREIKGDDRFGGRLPPAVRESSYVETLEENYRSGEVIVRYVDHLFKKKLKALLGSDRFQEDLTNLTDFSSKAAGDNKGKGYVRVLNLLVARKESSELEPEREALISIIRDAIKRNYRYRDLAVLAYKNRELVTILEWLTEANIPASASSSVDIRNRKVVAEMIELLKFLDSPVDDLAFANFLTGEILARATAGTDLEFRPDELRNLTLGAGSDTSLYLYQEFRQQTKFKLVWEEYFETLYQKTGYYPPYELLSLALKKFNVSENFPEDAEPLTKLLESLSALETAGRNSIRDFLTQTGEQRAELFKLERPEYTDAVDLLTYHKSKGLGYPIVINMLYESRNRVDNLLAAEEGNQTRVYRINQNLRNNCPRLEEIHHEKWIDGQVQRLNALYVICTRAESELYNLVVPSGAETLYTNIFEECELGERIVKPALDRKSLPSPTELQLGTEREAMEERDAGGGWSYERWLDTTRGEAYHRILQEMEFLISAREEVAQAVERSRNTFVYPLDLEEVKARLESFLSVPEVKEWFREAPGRVIYRERDYVDGSGETQRMDRVVVDDDHVAVIDFKTGERKDYSKQLGGYVSILKEIYPDRKITGHVAYIDSGMIEDIS